MNLSQMRALVRTDLHDEDSENYRWTDAELERHIQHAVSRFSQAIPLEDTADIATTQGYREMDVSSLNDRVLIQAVEYPVGEYPPSYQRFSLWADTLTILSTTTPDGSNARIYYGKLHTLDVSTSTIPAEFEYLIVLGATAHAMLQWANYAVNRVTLGGEHTAREYQAQGNERLNRFARELATFSSNNRVRISQLYSPASTPVSKSTVTGP